MKALGTSINPFTLPTRGCIKTKTMNSLKLKYDQTFPKQAFKNQIKRIILQNNMF